MNQIVIPFECNQQVDNDSLSININNISVNYTIENNNIIIDDTIVHGLSLLTIKVINPANDFLLKIQDLILDKVSVRHTLYLAFCQIENKKVCTTWLTNRDTTIIIPFGNPVSWWLSECSKKIPNKQYGTNLYEKMELYYPESIIIDDKFPKLLRDFMQFNLGFHVYNKSELKNPLHNKEIPYVKANLEYDEDLLFEEFSRNIDILNSDKYEPTQNLYNDKEIEKLDLWRVSMSVVTLEKSQDASGWKENLIYKQEDFPLFYDLIDRLIAIGGIRIVHAFIGRVYPYSYVAPHVDDLYRRDSRYDATYGCSQFYIPIGWKPGNYFKFADIGMIPYDMGCILVNNSNFMHASINASDTLRFTIGILCEFSNNNIIEYLDISG